MDTQNFANNLTDKISNSDQLIEELCTANFNDLVKKYGKEHLFEKIFTKDDKFTSVAIKIDFLRHLFILQFWPENQKRVELTKKQRGDIVNLVASIQSETTNEQILEGLKKINPLLELKSNFNKAESQQKAYRFYQAYNTMQTLLLDKFSYDYLMDTVNLFKMSDNRFGELSKEITLVSQNIQQELQKMVKEKSIHPNQNLINESLTVLRKLGRTPLFIESEKENAGIVHITDIFTKLDIALRAAAALKKKPPAPNENIENSARAEIANILQEDMTL
jgi:hypothetical protein